MDRRVSQTNPHRLIAGMPHRLIKAIRSPGAAPWFCLHGGFIVVRCVLKRSPIFQQRFLEGITTGPGDDP
jgi:hypothetical protein